MGRNAIQHAPIMAVRGKLGSGRARASRAAFDAASNPVPARAAGGAPTGAADAAALPGVVGGALAPLHFTGLFAARHNRTMQMGNAIAPNKMNDSKMVSSRVAL
jgi:hypothetical protein